MASLIGVEDCWEKAHSGGQRGYDLLVLMLSNKACRQPYLIDTTAWTPGRHTLFI